MVSLLPGVMDFGNRSTVYMRSAAADRVGVWDVDGADHTGVYETSPEDWRSRVEGGTVPVDGKSRVVVKGLP